MNTSMGRQGLNGLRRSRSSFRSLDSSTDSLATHTSHSSNSGGLQASGLRRSSSSLYLESLQSTPTRFPPRSSSSSLTSSSGSLNRKTAEGTFSPSAEVYEASFPPSCEFIDTESKALASWVVLLVLCLKVPPFVREWLAGFSASVPLLVMIGFLPGMVKAHLKQADTSDQRLSSSVASILSSNNSLSNVLEELYRTHSFGSQSELMNSFSSSQCIRQRRHHEHAPDEWGHFADFDETIDDSQVFSESATTFHSLQTLKETDDDE